MQGELKNRKALDPKVWASERGGSQHYYWAMIKTWWTHRDWRIACKQSKIPFKKYWQWRMKIC